MIIAIDASNIRAGGGLTHLKEIVNRADLGDNGIEKIVLLSNQHTLDKISSRAGIVKLSDKWLNRGMLFSFLFQIFKMNGVLKSNRVDLLFVPGGTYFGGFKPIVSMSQNMLPFERDESNRFQSWRTKLRFKILAKTQSHTFKKSKAVIYLTNYAKESIQSKLALENKSEIISHGINLNFQQLPKIQRSISEYTFEQPFNFLYVSIVTAYKHQWNVAEAILRLRKEGYPIKLQLVGSSTPESLEKLNAVIKKDEFACIDYKGLIDYDQLDKIYKQADGFVFASSCENQPIILIEAMSAGLPIACSDMGPMPEVLNDAGFYFNPLDVDSIYCTLKNFLENKEVRQINAEKAYNSIMNYTWKDCSEKTFELLSSFKDK
ncbi:glycosyltransferase family 4 protein [Amniculibacterium sp. G2-70]|uniref:glycosyltransferase family 4 protein n=1 Tax=Amniculibacterium sp. G2-70 TaxID=2767188 RepID=UPI001654B444|nr:glycosyltransferase family 1 protein [Amniculibacterium sp. G2-70]